jgi:hypothetical protein
LTAPSAQTTMKEDSASARRSEVGGQEARFKA